MATATFNEAEAYLVGDWSPARRLEVAMERIRKKYTTVAERIVELVQRRHRELDEWVIFITQQWGSGYIGFGRKAWGMDKYEWPSGYYVSNISLEALSDETADAPCADVSVKRAVKGGVDLKAVQEAVKGCAHKLLERKVMRACQFSDDRDAVISYRLPYTRQQLLAKLCKGDSQEYVDAIASCFDLLANFNSVLDKAIQPRPK